MVTADRQRGRTCELQGFFLENFSGTTALKKRKDILYKNIKTSLEIVSSDRAELSK